MYTIEMTSRFKRSYKKLEPKFQRMIKETLQKIAEDSTHPSLRVKKMQGYHNPFVWEASVNMDIRITFQVDKPNKLILRNCGHHDSALKKPL